MHDFGDVVDGRKSWKDLIGSLVQGGELGGLGGDSSSGARELGSRRKRRD